MASEAALIDYRPFRNTDPPQISDLWNFGKLGPGAAREFPNDALDMLVLAEPYFDKRGLIVACDGKELVGFVHAGFGANDAGTAVSTSAGVICAVVVRMDYRMQGIGRQLVVRAEEYLRSRGSVEIYAGESGTRNPFYLGLYGGAESGPDFIESDVNAARPFFATSGLSARRGRFVLMTRDISEKKDPFDPRMLTVKRTMKFGVLDHPLDATWWWLTRHGRFGSLTFNLIPNSGGAPPAEVTFWEMELHAANRGERTAGITGLTVAANDRRKGYAKALLTEVIRRLRDEVVTRVEVTIREDNTAALNLFHLPLNFESGSTTGHCVSDGRYARGRAGPAVRSDCLDQRATMPQCGNQALLGIAVMSVSNFPARLRSVVQRNSCCLRHAIKQFVLLFIALLPCRTHFFDPCHLAWSASGGSKIPSLEIIAPAGKTPASLPGRGLTADGKAGNDPPRSGGKPWLRPQAALVNNDSNASAMYRRQL